MKRISSVVSGMLKTGSLGRSVRLGEVWLNWDRIAGDDLAGRTRPVKISGRVLYVETDGSAVHHRASFVKDTLLSRVRAFTGGTYIRDIVLQSRARTPADRVSE